MQYTIAAHPTRYKDVLFRSRLEARWAAFFDLTYWNWRYEPFDFECWTPDFAISVHGQFDEFPEDTKFVEVKPYTKQDDWEGVIRKIQESSLDKHWDDGSLVRLCGIHPRASFHISYGMFEPSGKGYRHPKPIVLPVKTWNVGGDDSDDRRWEEAGRLVRYKG